MMIFGSARSAASCAIALSFSLFLSAGAQAQTVQSTAFVQSLAEAAASDEGAAAFYRGNGFDAIWTGPEDAARRGALLAALDGAGDHGLPVVRYDAGALRAAFAAAQTEGDVGRLEAAMTMAYLAYARDLSSGALVPHDVDDGIKREVVRPDPGLLLARIQGADPAGVLQDLAPDAPEYARLMREKFLLQARLASGGWGAPVAVESLEPGASGAQVVALRDRLVALGYLTRSVTQTYDRGLQAAVQRFQLDQGLTADGVAGVGTIAALNAEPTERLAAVIVAMERLRWLGDIDRSGRYIWVNQPDFTAQIIDDGAVTFQTRTVIGKDVPDQRSPEFSDVMEHMVVNPSWSVPRSITTKEYLPLLQRNPNAVGHLQVIDGNGRVVPRGAVNFAAYTAGSFPFALRQPPSDGNALGLVKFMFPNPYNIYLHDTPSKSLFEHEVRAYSHGCIRLAEPFDFAHVMLSLQSEDPKGTFKAELATGRETMVKFTEAVPVHLVYFTAWPNAKGRITYRADIYGRDGRIMDALIAAGVVMPDQQS